MGQLALIDQENQTNTAAVEFVNHKGETVAITVTGNAAVDIKQFAVTKEQIEEYMNKAKAIQITSLQDKPAYDEVYAMRQLVKKTRTSIGKIANILTEGAKAYTSDVNEAKKKWEEELKSVEQVLQSKEDHYDKLKEEAALREEQEREELEQARCSELIEMQMTFNGKVYAIESEDGVISVEHNKVSTYTNPQWAALIEAIRPAFEAKVKKQEEEKQRQLEIEAENNRLREIQRVKEERTKQLITIGLVYDGENFVFEDVNVHNSELATLNTEQWDVLISRIAPVVTERKAEIKAKQEAEEEAEKTRKHRAALINSERQDMMRLLGSDMSHFDLSELSQEDYKAMLDKAREESAEKEKAKTRSERAQASNPFLPYLKADQIFDGDFAEMTPAAFDQYMELCREAKKMYDQEQEELRALAAKQKVENEKKREEEKQREEEAKKAALAPDIEKLKDLAKRMRELQMPELASVNSESIAEKFNSQREKFAAWVESLSESL